MAEKRQKKPAPAKRDSKKQGPETVLVTGAAGCVGHFVVGHLLEKGYRVVAADLPGTPFPAGPRNRLAVKAGDLTDPAFAASLVAGVDHVINTAAVVQIGWPYARLEPINVSAVRYLYEAAARRPRKVKTFVHFSSGSIYAPSDRPVAEDHPIEPCNDYERSKALSEEYLRSKPDTGPRVNVVRPALIYGPRGKVLAALAAMLPPILGQISKTALALHGGPKSNWVHAEDVARATVFLIEDDAPHGEAFNVADDSPVSIGEVYNTAMEAAGIKLVRQPPIYYPMPLLKVAYPLLDQQFIFDGLTVALQAAWKRVVKKYGLLCELTPRFDREALIYGLRDTVFDNSKIKGRGFVLKHPDFAAGWQETVAWYKRERWIPDAL